MRMIDSDAVIKAIDKHTFETDDGLCLDDDISCILEEVPTIEERKWIPCGERMPEEYTRVIGYMAWHAMTAIEYQHGRWFSIDHLEPLPDEAVSHWMPLPKPPKEENK